MPEAQRRSRKSFVTLELASPTFESLDFNLWVEPLDLNTWKKTTRLLPRNDLHDITTAITPNLYLAWRIISANCRMHECLCIVITKLKGKELLWLLCKKTNKKKLKNHFPAMLMWNARPSSRDALLPLFANSFPIVYFVSFCPNRLNFFYSLQVYGVCTRVSSQIWPDL